jgi:hypothetical protein
MESSLIEYINELVGTPYVWWNEGEYTSDKPTPFWINKDLVLSTKNVQESGCNCAGFINLLCHHVGSCIPGAVLELYYAGGTAVWFDYLSCMGLLSKFHITIAHHLPPFTLLIRNYQSPEDQGHVAVVLPASRLAHCYPDAGITIDNSIATSNSWLGGNYYTHYCLPQHWLYRVHSLSLFE